jgi:hypothetical protein
MVGLGPSGKGRRDTQERNESRWLDVSFPDLGHSMIAFLARQSSRHVAAHSGVLHSGVRVEEIEDPHFAR